MANIYDVAKAARVSVATVSAVVNGSAYVSPPLKARVRRAVEKLHYNPNLVARSLAKQRTGTIALIVPNVADPFWPEVISGVESAATARGYTLLLASGHDDAELEGRHVRTALAKRVDGILLTKSPGPLARDLAGQLKSSRTPVVQLFTAERTVGRDAVSVAEEAGAYEAVAHLLRLGCRRIGLLNAPPGTRAATGMSAGYRRALDTWQRAYEPGLVLSARAAIDSGYTAGIALLQHEPDAVFVASYLTTAGLMGALKQYQRRVPDEIAVVCADEQPWLDAFAPRLTTVNVPRYDVGRRGAELLIDRLERGERATGRARPMSVTLDTSLTIRDSCGYHRRMADPAWKPVESPRR